MATAINSDVLMESERIMDVKFEKNAVINNEYASGSYF
jgi:hypothetical protein